MSRFGLVPILLVVVLTGCETTPSPVECSLPTNSGREISSRVLRVSVEECELLRTFARVAYEKDEHLSYMHLRDEVWTVRFSYGIGGIPTVIIRYKDNNGLCPSDTRRALVNGALSCLTEDYGSWFIETGIIETGVPQSERRL